MLTVRPFESARTSLPRDIELDNVYRQLEKAKQLSHRLALATQSAKIATWVYDVDTGHLDWDDQMFELYGVSRKNFKGQCEDWRNALHPDDVDQAEADVQQSIQTESNFLPNFRVVRPDGEIRHVEGQAILEQRPGQSDRMIGVNWDVTALKNSMQSQKQTSEHLELATSSAGMGIWEYIVEDNILYWDDAMFELYELENTGSIVPYETWESTLSEPDVTRAHELMGRLVEHGEPFSWIFEAQTTSGVKYVSSHGTVRYGGKTHIVGINWDVTEQETARQREEEANQLKSEFLANMSHEIRTPLNGVLGMTQLLGRTELSERQIGMVSTIRMSGTALLTVINNVLDLSQIEAGLLELKPETVNLGETLQLAIEATKGAAEIKNLPILLDIDEALPSECVIDQRRLSQVLIILVGNAVKFTHSGHVKVTAQCSGRDKMLIAVEDTGIRIPKEKHETIFERFRQADNSVARAFDGTGIGLTICKEFVELMDGTILIDPGFESGTRITVEIPFLNAGKGIKTEEAERNSPAVLDRDIKVLLAEDNNVSRMIIDDFFADDPKIEISAFENGKLAIEACQDRDFDLILMDINMPVMSGDDAIRHIRANEDGDQAIPIIALTAMALKDERERLLSIGANYHVPKPINLDELRSLIYRLADLEDSARKSVLSRIG
jgi:PAS domain S-box-containing protein